MSKLRTKRLKKPGSNRLRLLQRITKEIERQQTEIAPPRVDSQDNDLMSYVASFQEDVARLPKLEKFSLMTPESARDALVMLDKNHAEVSRLLRNAKALRTLLEREA